MASIKIHKQPKRLVLDRILGLNENYTGDTGLEYGESGSLCNVRITRDGKLKRMDGYEKIFPKLDHGINKIWSGKLNGIFKVVFASNGTIYDLNMSDYSYTSIGTVESEQIFMFGFSEKLYVKAGADYKSWDGTEELKTVEGYIPCVYKNTRPDGKGDKYESFNMLTKKKHQTFNGDGSSTEYILAEKDIASIDNVIVNGSEVTSFTSNLSAGKVIFSTAPSGGDVDNVDIYWTGKKDERDIFLKCNFFTSFGVINDTKILAYGDKNIVRFSSLADGKASAEFFGGNDYTAVGVANTDVRDIITYQGKMLIHKEDFLHSGNIEIINNQELLETSELTKTKTYPFAQGQIINGVPIQVGEQLYRIISTNVKDERGVPPFSERILKTLSTLDLTKAITLDYEKLTEYWIAIDNIVYLYNYTSDTFTRLELAHTPTSFIVIDGIVYFSTTDGTIMKFTNKTPLYDGIDMDWHWQLNMEAFGATYLEKTIKSLHINTNPEQDQYVKVEYYVDGIGWTEHSVAINNIHFDLENLDLENFTLNTNYDPSPSRMQINAKKFAFFSLRLSGGGRGKFATITSIAPNVMYGTEVK